MKQICERNLLLCWHIGARSPFQAFVAMLASLSHVDFTAMHLLQMCTNSSSKNETIREHHHACISTLSQPDGKTIRCMPVLVQATPKIQKAHDVSAEMAQQGMDDQH